MFLERNPSYRVNYASCGTGHTAPQWQYAAGWLDLIVRFLLQPAAWIAPEVEASSLVVYEDRQHERQSGQPPHESAK